MKLINRWILAASAAQRWYIAYHGLGPMGSWGASEWRQRNERIYERLTALGGNPNPDDVDGIIGNTSWTDPGRCHECGKCPGELVQLGEEPDQESNTACICVNCVFEAIKLLEP